MKKNLVLILICLLLLNFSSCGKNNDETLNNEKVIETSASSTKDDNMETTSLDSTSTDLSVTSSTQKKVESFVKSQINASDGTKIDSLTVMKTQGTDGTDDYKVYAIITLKHKNTPSEIHQVIQDYSNNIASSIDSKLGNVQYLSLVWLASNIDGTASVTYEKTDGMLTLKDEVYDKKFGIESENTTDSTIEANTDTTLNPIVTESAVNSEN